MRLWLSNRLVMKIHENSHSNTLLRILPTVMHKITHNHGSFSPRNSTTEPIFFCQEVSWGKSLGKSLGKATWQDSRMPFVLSSQGTQGTGITRIGEITRSYASYTSYAPGPPRRKWFWIVTGWFSHLSPSFQWRGGVFGRKWLEMIQGIYTEHGKRISVLNHSSTSQCPSQCPWAPDLSSGSTFTDRSIWAEASWKLHQKKLIKWETWRGSYSFFPDSAFSGFSKFEFADFSLAEGRKKQKKTCSIENHHL